MERILPAFWPIKTVIFVVKIIEYAIIIKKKEKKRNEKKDRMKIDWNNFRKKSIKKVIKTKEGRKEGMNVWMKDAINYWVVK